MNIYVVVEFGCNSSYNDMWPPKVQVFIDKDAAMAVYSKLKKGIEGVPYKEYNNDNSMTIIQQGGDEGAKRPEGAMIAVHQIQTLRGAW